MVLLVLHRAQASKPPYVCSLSLPILEHAAYSQAPRLLELSVIHQLVFATPYILSPMLSHSVVPLVQQQIPVPIGVDPLCAHASHVLYPWNHRTLPVSLPWVKMRVYIWVAIRVCVRGGVSDLFPYIGCSQLAAFIFMLTNEVCL